MCNSKFNIDAVNAPIKDHPIASDILKELDKNKATEVKVYKGGAITDFMIVACSESGKHSKSLANLITDILKQQGVDHHVEGYDQANWILIDLYDFMVHIFRPEVRDYYQVDSLWG